MTSQPGAADHSLEAVHDSSMSPEVNLEGASFTSTKLITVSESSIQSSSEQNLSWANHGLTLQLEPGTLSETQSECNFTLGATCKVSGCFEIPHDVKPVSPIYYIKPSVKLLKPVKLEIEHCCSVPNEKETQNLVAMLSQNSNQTPPYTFEYLEGGEFPEKRFWGSILALPVSTDYNLLLVVNRGSKKSTMYHAKVCYRQQNAIVYKLLIALCHNLSHCKVKNKPHSSVLLSYNDM